MTLFVFVIDILYDWRGLKTAYLACSSWNDLMFANIEISMIANILMQNIANINVANINTREKIRFRKLIFNTIFSLFCINLTNFLHNQNFDAKIVLVW